MEDIYVIGHKSPDTDSVVSAIVYAGIKGYKPAISGKINAETDFILSKLEVSVPEIMTSAEGKKLVLVDHNEPSQRVDEKGEVIEIIDHHKASMSFSSPIPIRIEPLGATSTLIAKMYPNEVKGNPIWAGLLLSGIISDTIIFKSPTTTQEDRDVAANLSAACGISDMISYGIEMKKANSAIAGREINDVLQTDMKEFDMSGRKVSISAAEVVDMSEVEARKAEILSCLNELKNEGREAALFAVADIINEKSLIYFAADKDIMEKAFGVQAEDGNTLRFASVISRKKQVVPPLEEAFKSL
ncbi:MAG: manganese-dependent inorganic pyrophosphatase [Candidatus Colwellbacteria bacterium]|nr:manganese-dependent inorganic pyrophosphatase [Candidatus Colwellbacteria bacterium]